MELLRPHRSRVIGWAIAATALLIFAAYLLAIFASAGAEAMNEGSPQDVKTFCIIYPMFVLFIAWFSAYFSSSTVLSVELADSTTYRTGNKTFNISPSDIRAITVVTSLRGWRYIIVRTGEAKYVMANLIWSDADFETLRRALANWTSRYLPALQVEEAKTYKASDQLKPYKLPHYFYNSYLRNVIIFGCAGAVIYLMINLCH